MVILKVLFCGLLLTLPVAAQKSSLHIESQRHAHAQDWAQAMRSDRVMPGLIKDFSSWVRLPHPVAVTYADTGKVTAWYSPAQHRVTVDYSLLDFVYRVFRQDPRYHSRARELTIRTGRFLVLHQLGHAMMAELNPPYSGKQEDCADELAVILATNLPHAEGRADAQAAAQWFVLMGREKQQVAFWEEHSFELQRYYHLLFDLEASCPGLLPEGLIKADPDRLTRASQDWPARRAAWAYQLGKSCSKPSPSPKPVPRPGSGTIGLTFEEAAEPDLLLVAGEMRKLPLPTLLLTFEKQFMLPRNLEVAFINSRQPICRYQSENHRVAISYGWINEAGKFLGTQSTDGKVILSKLGSLVSLELGARVQQMLLEELQIPITGEPEDAAVELLTRVCLESPIMRDLVVDAADYYGWKAEANPFMVSYDFSSQDNLHYQRFLDLVMALYGQDPQRLAGVKDWLPARRLHLARLEQSVKNKNWERLLGPYLRH